jgi:hypothetical protein
MGKTQFQDPIEHWMLVPRQKLVSLYIDEYAATMSEIIRMANHAAESADSENPPPVAKYAQLEAQTYAAPTGVLLRVSDGALLTAHCSECVPGRCAPRACLPLLVWCLPRVD